MRDWKAEIQKRVAFIRDVLAESGAKGIIFGNSGGKDSALVGILCKMACDDTLGVMMPCSSMINYGQDIDDAELLAKQYKIRNTTVDLTKTRETLIGACHSDSMNSVTLSSGAVSNIAPRLRMAALYAIGQSENRIVAGTGNKSEIYMGYFTKWGDGGYDFNPIADLTATEVLEFLRYLKVPMSITDKAPSAGLYEGQTDEEDMGITYSALDGFLTGGAVREQDKETIDKAYNSTEHKRRMPRIFSE